MTQEEINYLKRFESNFQTAINHNYTRAIPSTYLKEIVKIYEKYNSKITICYHCSSSILSALKVIGRWYIKITEEKIVEDGKTSKNVRRRKDK